MSVYAIIPAAGSGSRFGGPLPKQFVEVDGKPLLAYTLDVFEQSRLVDGILVAVSPDFLALRDQLMQRYGYKKLLPFTEGGAERQETVYKALSSLNCEPDDIIAVHDAARPLLPGNVLDAVLRSASETGSSVVGLKRPDTVVYQEGGIMKYLDRQALISVQTPQVFRYSVLLKALTTAVTDRFSGTDESMLVHRTGTEVHFTEGSPLNFKVTTTEDLELFRAIIKSRTTHH